MSPLDQEKFLKIARSIPDDPRVPYAFERRVMAHLRTAPGGEFAPPWTRLLWKAAMACLVISLGTGVLASFLEEPAAPEILNAELEQTVFAPMVLDEEVW